MNKCLHSTLIPFRLPMYMPIPWVAFWATTRPTVARAWHAINADLGAQQRHMQNQLEWPSGVIPVRMFALRPEKMVSEQPERHAGRADSFLFGVLKCVVHVVHSRIFKHLFLFCYFVCAGHAWPP